MEFDYEAPSNYGITNCDSPTVVCTRLTLQKIRCGLHLLLNIMKRLFGSYEKHSREQHENSRLDGELQLAKVNLNRLAWTGSTQEEDDLILIPAVSIML